MIRLLAFVNAVLFLVYPLIGPGWAPEGPSAVPARDATPPSLVHLLPEQAVLAVEIRDLDRRWPEVRGLPAIARFQERLLEGSGLEPDDLPRLAGSRAVFALVPGADGLVPVGLLRPRGRSMKRLLATGLAVHPGRGALWIGPPGAEGLLEEMAAGERAGFTGAVDIDGVARRLPPGGLARGWIHPQALARFLRSPAPGTRSEGVEMLASFAAAELDLVRCAGFRRDVAPEGIETEAVFVYDTSRMPPEVAAIFDPAAAPPPLPSPLPREVALALAWRPEPRALGPWLRYAAGSDPRGPLRNLDFWMDEFEERSGRDLDADLFGPLGDHAWCFVLNGGGPLDAVEIYEARDPDRIVDTLVDLRLWLRDQAWGRTLGLALPAAGDATVDGEVLRGLRFWTPFGEMPGLLFLAADGHLLVGTSERSITRGRLLLRQKETWMRVPQAHGSFRARGPALAPLAEALVEATCLGERYPRLAEALAELVKEAESFSGEMTYEEGAIRLRGSADFRN